MTAVMSRTSLLAPLATLTLLLTLALITLGGVVHATGSSLACPDWPTCYGEWMPEMVGGIFYEHGHRMLGTLVGACAIALVLLAWGTAHSRLARWLLLGVVVQGVLGGLTVLLGLSVAVSSLHLALGTSLAAGFAVLASRARAARASGSRQCTPAEARAVEHAALAVFAQLVLGALVRHLDAGTACGVDLVRCAGVWLTTWGTGALQMLHRAGALVVVAMTARMLVQGRGNRAMRVPSALVLALLLAQIVLGLASVATVLAVWVVTLHLVVGVLSFVALVLLRARMSLAPRSATDERESPRIAHAQSI